MMRLRLSSLVPWLVFGAVTVAHGTTKDVQGIVQELGTKLSKGAKVFGKGDAEFKAHNWRWQYWSAPDVKVIVDVMTEEDVIEVIRYATRNNIPFFPQVSGHGAGKSYANIKKGIQLNMRSMNSISISEHGTYATVGGGIKGKELTDALWKQGKQTVTGICECVGLVGVALGGGHGILQGQHGLLSDQILSLRLVLANTSLITVSPTSHSELFWAMQGAGHNFGVVTSMQYRIYDVDFDNGKNVWSYEALTYPATAENIRSVYEIAKEQVDTQPEGFLQYGLVTTNSKVSPEPILIHHVVYNGHLANISQYTEPYWNLRPIATAQEEGTYVDMPRFIQAEENGMVCRAQEFIPGAGVIRIPVDVKTYHFDALVKAVEEFIRVTREKPVFMGSFFMIEQYSVQGVLRKDAEKSVFPSREDRILLAPTLFYPSFDTTTNTHKHELDTEALQIATLLRQIIIDGAKDNGGFHSYVNYAHGGESLENVYGKGNLERLRELKKIYDPENWFRHYMPIVSETGNETKADVSKEKDEIGREAERVRDEL